mgnify:CR=1 FL=1
MEVPSSITDKEIHNYLSEIKPQLTFTLSKRDSFYYANDRKQYR